MSKHKLLAIILLPQVAAFFAVRNVWRAVTDAHEEMMDGFELAVLDELLSWERTSAGFTDPDDDRLIPRVL